MSDLLRNLHADTWRVNGVYSARKLLLTTIRYPTFRVILSYRLCSHFSRKKGLFRIGYFLLRWLHRRNQLAIGLEIPVSSTIGPGLLVHHGWATVINDNAVLGSNVTLLHSVTIGGTEDGAPIIGDDVTIAAGAIILGPVVVGNRAIVGAGAIVTKNVPPGAVVAGNPAKVLREGNSKEPKNRFSLPERPSFN